MLSGEYWNLGYALGLSWSLSAPYYVNVEPTNHCNLRCTICSRAKGIPRGYMAWDLFKEIADQCSSLGVRQVSLFLGGESTLHPDLPRMVAYVEQKGLISGLHTNATLLSAKMSQQLLEAGLSQISISLDGKTPEEYEEIRRGANYQETVGNVLAFLELKKSLGTPGPDTIIQTILPFQADMQDQKGWVHYPKPEEGFVGRFQGLPVDEIRVLLPHTWRGEKKGIAHRPRGSVYFPCKHMWMGLSIAWDGRVMGCCNDLNRFHIRGSIPEDSLRSIWRGREVRCLRRLQVRRQHHLIPLCRDCHEVWRDEHPLRSWLRKALVVRRTRVFIPSFGTGMFRLASRICGCLRRL
ncbi:MAG: radical SAM protein [Chloroflexi bacterium]|nr:radical SAM protein [Chloroflexota bacterium]